MWNLSAGLPAEGKTRKKDTVAVGQGEDRLYWNDFIAGGSDLCRLIPGGAGRILCIPFGEGQGWECSGKGFHSNS